MAISVKNLTKTYRVKKGAETQALKGVSFDLPDTGMVFILGKSGCGKSTLLNLLGGLDSFDGGDIIVDGRSMKDYRAAELDKYRNGYVGFVFQENNLLEEYTVKRNVELALDLRSQKDVESSIEQALESVDLKDFADRKCNSISGGQKQRVAITRALIKQPKMLLCDEPTGALDSETGEDIFGLLKSISVQKLVVVVSHDRESAEKYGDRIIEIKDGKILSDSAPLTLTEEKPADDIKQHKNGLCFKRAFTLGAGYIIARPVRFALCLLLCLITFTFVGFADAIASYDHASAIYHTMEAYGINHYSFGKFGSNGPNSYSISISGIGDDEFKMLSDWTNTSRLDKVYRIGGEVGGMYFFSQLSIEGAEHKGNCSYFMYDSYLEIDESFPENYGYELVAGRLPQNYEEVVITLHTFKGFKKYGYREAHTVRGEDGKLLTEYGDEVSVKEYSDMLGKTVSVGQNGQRYFYINGNENPQIIEMTKTEYKVVGIINTHIDEEKFGKFLYEDAVIEDEVLDDEIGYAFFLNKFDCCLFFKQGYRENIGFEKWKEYSLRSDEEQIDDCKLVVAPYNGSKAEKIENISVFKNKFNKDEYGNGNCFHISDQSYWMISDLDRTFSDVSEYYVYITLGISLVSVLFILYYTSGTVAEKRREIGVLRALGASRWDILKILACEHGLFAAAAILISSALSAIGVAIVNSYFTAGIGISTIIVYFGIRQFALITGIALLAVVLGVAIPIIKLLKAKPVDVIAGRK